MISTAKIDNAFSHLKTFVESDPAIDTFPVIAAEQKGRALPYPFATYKVLSKPVNNSHSANQSYEDDIDAAKVQVHTDRKSFANVSFTVYSDSMIQAWDLTEKIFEYIETQTCKAAMKALSVFPRAIDPNPTDRTALIEFEYEYRVGFDIRFEWTERSTETIDAVDESTLEAVGSTV